jgi:sucrose-phosphate synthase
MRSPQERNTRLENMTWRIWNLARKKKEVSAVLSPVVFFSLGRACASSKYRSALDGARGDHSTDRLVISLSELDRRVFF